MITLAIEPAACSLAMTAFSLPPPAFSLLQGKLG